MTILYPATRGRELASSRTTRIVFLMLLLACSGLLLQSCDKEDRLTFKKGELFFDKKIPTTVVNKIGAALTSDSIFQDSRETSAKLLKPDSIYQLLIVFDLTKLTPGAIDEMRYMGLRYSEDILSGAPLDVIICDDEWKPKQTLPYRSLGRFLSVKDGRMFYSEAAGLEAATKLKDFLVKDGFFEGGDKITRLDKNADGYIIQIYADEKKSRSESEQNDMRDEMKDWSQEVFDGTPITVQLCDLGMKAFLTIKPDATRS